MPSVEFCRMQFEELTKDIHIAAADNNPDLMGTYLDSLMTAGRDYQEAIQARTDHQAEVQTRMQLPQMTRNLMTLEQMVEARRLPALVGGESPSD